MKKLIVSLFCAFFALALSDARAQASPGSTNAKDQYWGTAKSQTGASADAVGKRGAGLDTRFNAYEDGRRGSFAKKRIMQSKRMKEILKQEAKMHKKHKRDKRRLRRSQG